MKRLIGLCFLIPLLAQGAASVISQPSGPGSHSSATNVAAADITDATATGIALMTAADAAAGRIALEAVSTNNPTTTGTFTHNGTNIVATTDALTMNYGLENTLVITNGRIGVGKSNPSFELDVIGTVKASTYLRSGLAVVAGSTSDTTATTPSIFAAGGIYATKGISSAYSLIRSNAPSAAARGANTLIQEFNTNQWRVIATDAATNEMVLATLSTAGALELLATPTAGTSNNVVATTKFVNDAVAASGGGTPAPANLTWSAFSVLTDASLSSHFRVTLTNASSATLANPSNPTDGKLATWEIIQDATGNRALGFDTKWAFGSDITGATVTTNATKRDFIRAVYNSTADKWFVVGFLRGY